MQYEIIVSGIVQGVSFRYYTQKQAQKLGLVGCVKNQIDGSVKIIAQGDKLTLDKLKDWCFSGSPYSNVSEVNCQVTDQTGKFTSFKIVF